MRRVPKPVALSSMRTQSAAATATASAVVASEHGSGGGHALTSAAPSAATPAIPVGKAALAAAVGTGSAAAVAEAEAKTAAVTHRSWGSAPPATSSTSTGHSARPDFGAFLNAVPSAPSEPQKGYRNYPAGFFFSFLKKI